MHASSVAVSSLEPEPKLDDGMDPFVFGRGESTIGRPFAFKTFCIRAGVFIVAGWLSGGNGRRRQALRFRRDSASVETRGQAALLPGLHGRPIDLPFAHLDLTLGPCRYR